MSDDPITERERKDLLKRFINDPAEQELQQWAAQEFPSALNIEKYCKGFSKAKMDVVEKYVLACRIPKHHSVNEMVEALYISGCGLNEICYHVYKAGYKGITSHSIKEVIDNRKYRLNILRKKFMSDILQLKAGVFQKFSAEVHQAESNNIIIYLNKIEDLQQRMLQTDPFDEEASPTFSQLMNMVEKIQETMNRSHGVEDIRKAQIDLSSKLELARGLQQIKDDAYFKLQNGQGHGKSIEGGNISPAAIDASSPILD